MSVEYEYLACIPLALMVGIKKIQAIEYAR